MTIWTDPTHAQDSKADKRTGYKYTIIKLADVTGFSRTTIENYIAKGLPVAYKGLPGGNPTKIDTAVFITWLVRQERERIDAEHKHDEVGSLDFKDRRMAAQAESAEITLARLKGEIVSIDVVEEVVTNAITDSRARLLAIPTKVAPQLTAISRASVIKQILELAINEALNELSRIDPADYTDKTVYVPLEPAAETDSQSVGGSETDSQH